MYSAYKLNKLCGSQQTEKFFKRWKYQTTLPASCMHIKKQQLEPDMEQQTGSKSGKEYIKAEYCHLAKSWRWLSDWTATTSISTSVNQMLGDSMGHTEFLNVAQKLEY